MVAVRVDALEKRFGSTTVLDGVSLEVADGAFAVLVGPSGCGKSTLLRLLAGLERADAGSIRFGARDVSELEPRERDIAMVFQSYALYPHLSVRDNLAFGLRLRKESAERIAERVAEVSEMLGIGPLLARMPRELSGGQRQRVAMGRAIVRRPSLFLFDEPLSNLDAALRSQVRVDIRKLHEKLGTTSIYVTHDQVEAMTLADVMFVLNRGRVEQAGAPLEVYNKPATRFVAGFLGSPAMNFVDAVVHRGDGRWELSFGAALLSGSAPDGAERDRATLALGEAWSSLEEGAEVTLGIRPHDLAVANGQSARTLEGRLAFAEALGGETYAHVAVAGERLIARLDAGQNVRVGQPLRLAVERVHLFDRASGAAKSC